MWLQALLVQCTETGIINGKSKWTFRWEWFVWRSAVGVQWSLPPPPLVKIFSASYQNSKVQEYLKKKWYLLPLPAALSSLPTALTYLVGRGLHGEKRQPKKNWYKRTILVLIVAAFFWGCFARNPPGTTTTTTVPQGARTCREIGYESVCMCV